MPGPMNNEQLRAWYTEFSSLLLKEADIDVNTSTSLGLIKNIEVTKWDTTNIDAPDIKITYPYANESAVPFSDTASKQDHSNWLTANLKPAVTEDQIRRLYNMSREGTLMLSCPDKGLKDLRMVRTDPSGKIIVSQPISAYRKAGNENLPQEDRIPDMPDKPASSLNPEDYGIRPRPTAPQEPENMHPGFWAWLGYKLFGIENDYAKLERYEQAMDTYLKEALRWELDVNEKANGNETIAETGETRQVRYEEYRQARAEHDRLAMPLDSFMSNPMGKFSAVATSAAKLMNTLFWRDENGTVGYNHTSTTRGKAKKQLEALNQKLRNEERTDVFLHNWWGHDADPAKVTQYFTFTLDNLQVKPLEFPKSPDFDQMTEADQANHSKYMSDLFDLAVLSAMVDPEITGKNPKPGRTNLDQARNRFGHIFNDMITSGRGQVTEYFAFIEPAREKVMDAMESYTKGEKGPLANILCQGMRQLLLTSHGAKFFKDHVFNTPYVVGKMYNLLQQDKDLLQATGLKEDELQDVRSQMELYQIMRQGLQSKKDILDHAFERRTLSPEALQKAAGDILLFHHVMLGVEAGYKKNEKALQSSDEYMKLIDSLSVPVDENDPTKGRTGADRATVDKVTKQLEALDELLPPNEFTMGLLNKDGVKQYMQGILEKSNLSKIGEMSCEELRNLFAKNDKEIVSFLMPPNPKPAPEQKGPNTQKELSNQQNKESPAPQIGG